eukprot:SAG31_NODE_1028_length_10273_cov_22.700413_4_plen_1559_part_00
MYNVAMLSACTDTCDCSVGWTGINCGEEDDLCEPSPCLHSGICSQELGVVSCECSSTGYEGASCETEVDECAESPCLHGGICQDLTNAFQCQCSTGYEGSTCEACASGYTMVCGDNSCRDDHCEPAIDCEGNWGAWSRCDLPCGGGTQERDYEITVTAQNGGSPCPSPSTQLRSCNTEPCPVDCAGSWSAYDDCTAVCGGGVQLRTYHISVDAANGGRMGTCEAADGSTELRACNSDPCPQDCEGDWGTWSDCSLPCGNGRRTRQYTVTTVAAYGGADCEIPSGTTETIECNSHACPVPVDCSGVWGVWTDCSAECGGGERSRSYQVITAAAYGGSDGTCQAPDATIQTESCNSDACPVDCEGSWSPWEACTEPCGGGTQLRTYSVDNPASNGGTECPSETTQTQSCNTQDCPVDCAGSWSDWDACSAECDGGTQQRVYTVSVQASDGGTACPSDSPETRSCNLQGCPVPCAGTWRLWSDCSQPCGGGTQHRTFTVTTPASNGGTACPATVSQACNTIGCPVDCSGSWSSWSACSAQCGGGIQARNYTIHVQPSNDGAECPSETQQHRICNSDECVETSIDCAGAWAAWTDCSAECGGGTQQREFQVAVASQNGGAPCPTPLSEEQDCNIDACPVDCEGSWSPWEACTEPCGGGTQLRTYSVDNPASNGGTECPSETTQTQSCNTQDCPVDCAGSWSDWDACSAECDGGTQQRVYTVSVQASDGGTACPSDSPETRSCNLQGCPVPCAGTWRLWSDCSQPCGGGTQHRTFTVTTPASNGGTACPATVSQACNTIGCPVDCSGSWSSWSACSAQCGGGQRLRIFSITEPAMNGGSNCSATNGSTDHLTCNVQPCPIVRTPVDCFGDWASWSACSNICGGGIRSRVYSVLTQAANGGNTESCTESHGHVQNQTCNSEPCPVDCEGSWSNYTSCSQSCGGGSRSRTYSISQQAAYGGSVLACDATDGYTTIEECNLNPCPVDCAGSWSTWSTCSTACGSVGIKSRMYTLTTPASYGGNSTCSEAGAVQNRSCGFTACRTHVGVRLGGYVPENRFKAAIENQTSTHVRIMGVLYEINSSVILPFDPLVWQNSLAIQEQFRRGVAATFGASTSRVSILQIEASRRRRLAEDLSLRADYNVHTENTSISFGVSDDLFAASLATNIEESGDSIASFDSSVLIFPSTPTVTSELIFEIATDEDSQISSNDEILDILSDVSSLELALAAQGIVADILNPPEGVRSPESLCATNSVCPSGTFCEDSESQCTCASSAGTWDCDLLNQCDAAQICENGGFCIDGWRSFSCECTAAYTGRYCEEEVDECDSAPCQNGGACYDGTGFFNCSCPNSHAGYHCEIAVDPCDSNPCLNGGICSTKNLTTNIMVASCLCSEKFTGAMCGTSRGGWWSVDEGANISYTVIISNALVVTFCVSGFLTLLKNKSGTSASKTEGKNSHSATSETVSLQRDSPNGALTLDVSTSKGIDAHGRQVADEAAPTVTLAMVDSKNVGMKHSMLCTFRMIGSILPAILLTAAFGFADFELFPYYGTSVTQEHSPQLMFFVDMQAFL